MNINDVNQIQEPSPLFSEGDKLDQIFIAQKKLMGNYLPIAEEHYRKVFGTEIKIPKEVWEGNEGNLHTKIGNELIVSMINAAIHELSEAVQTMKVWKPWKGTEIPTDVEHWKEEMVDSFHFFIETLLLTGMTAKELYEIYFKKNQVNQFRQKSNY